MGDGVGVSADDPEPNQPTIITQVAPPHQWYGLDVTGSRILYDNPDTIYRFVGVNYASEYVITGQLPENDPQASFSVLTERPGRRRPSSTPTSSNWGPTAPS